MPGPYGLTTAGFVGKPAADSKTDFDDAFAGIFGESIKDDTGEVPAATSIGQEIALLVDSESSAWEVLGAIYSAFDSEQAVRPQLQILCALTGTTEKKAARSTVIVTCTGVLATLIPAGRVVTETTLGTRFLSSDDATLVALGAWAPTTAYTVGQAVSNGGNWYIVQVAGVSGAGPGPVGTGSGITEGTVTWVGFSTATPGAYAAVAFAAEDTGPLQAAAGTLVTIATPVSGWTGAVNSIAATPGRDLETEPALRSRRVLELQAPGGGPADAIRADILAITEVEDCRVFVNTGDVVDGDGVPAHGVEVLILAPLVSPTTDAELAADVWAAVGGGTATGGTTLETVTDDSGNPQSVRFSRPSEIAIDIEATVYYDATVWTGVSAAAAVAAAAQSALLTFADSYYSIGYDVRVQPLAGAVQFGPSAVDTSTGSPVPIYPAPAGSSAIPGIVDVDLKIRTGANPFAYTDISIAIREIATFAVGDITITATSEAP